MEWWYRVMFPLRRAWLGVTTRLRLRKTGLWKLRQEVSTCEYEDVRVMWEMIHQADGRRRRRRRGWAAFRSAAGGGAPYSRCCWTF